MWGQGEVNPWALNLCQRDPRKRGLGFLIASHSRHDETKIVTFSLALAAHLECVVQDEAREHVQSEAAGGRTEHPDQADSNEERGCRWRIRR